MAGLFLLCAKIRSGGAVMPTVDDFLSELDTEYINPYTNTNKVSWINELELRYKLEVDQDISFFEISRLANVAEYDMAAGVVFKDIKIVYIDKAPADPIDLTSYEKIGYYKGTGGKFTVYPVPTISDSTPGIRVVHIVRPTKKIVGNILTDTLLIEDEFINVYKFWLFSKMALLNKEFDEYNSWSTLFNEEWKSLAKWINRTKPKTADGLSQCKNVL
jgi:hypothetical protein